MNHNFFRGAGEAYVAGGWGYGNRGDNAILASMLTSLRLRCPHLTLHVTSFSPAETLALNGIGSVASIHTLLHRSHPQALKHLASLALWRATGLAGALTAELHEHRRLIASCDVVVLGGGGYLNDHWPGMLRSVRATLDLAAASGTPVVVYGQTLGPFAGNGLRRALKQRGSLAAVACRDRQSAQAAKAVGVGTDVLWLTADEANLVERPAAAPATDGLHVGVMCQGFRPHLNTQGRSPPGSILSAADYTERLCRSLVALQGRHAELRYSFIPSTTWDEPFCREVRARIDAASGRESRWVDTSDLSRFVTACQSVDLMFSTNMHPVILAATNGRPSVALSYHYKLDDFMQSIGLAEQVLRIDDFDPDVLAATLHEALRDRERLAATVEEHHRLVRRRAKGNGRLLARVLNERAVYRRAPSHEQPFEGGARLAT